MSGAEVNAGLDLATNEVRALPDGRRWLAALQATADAHGGGGVEAFGGRKLVATPGLDLLLGAWAGAPWNDLKHPQAGIRLTAEF